MSDVPQQTHPEGPGIRLLRTKLFIPPAHPELVSRPRLVARLDAGLQANLTLIAAPAGFGKTTLLSAWIAERALPVGWLSLDAYDNDPVTFWAYVIAALQTVNPMVGQASRAMLLSPQSPPVEGILTELLNDIAALDESLVLVLDDYHTISEEAIHTGLTFLVEHRPPQLHVILASREEPPLPLALLRARRQLVEVGAADLRFTVPEAEAFLRQAMGQALRPDDVAALTSLTEGWAAGLQLAALSMQEVGDIAELVASFSGSNRYVLDYLAHEIYSRQPPERRDFLMRTAILGRMTASLCDAITGRSDGRVQLAGLEHANLFIVPLDQQRHWYRYHHLFSDFLRLRLDESLPADEIAALHRRASAWFAAHEALPEAIDHALAANDFAAAEGLVADAVMTAFRHSELRTLVGWLDRLPSEIVAKNAFLSMAMAWALLATGQAETIERHLQDIERQIGAVPDGSPASMALPVETRGVLGELCVTRATLAFNHQDLAEAQRLCELGRAYLGHDAMGGVFHTRLSMLGIIAFDLALVYEFGGQTEAAVQAFEEALVFIREDENPHLQPMAISHLAQLQVLQGRLPAARQTYEAALRAAGNLGPVSPLSGLAHTGLGALLYEWNEIDEAVPYLQQGIELGRPWAHWEILVIGYGVLSKIDLARGDPGAALARLDEFAAFAQRMAMPWAIPALDAFRAEAWVQCGAIDRAVAWAETLGLPEEGLLYYFFEGAAAVAAAVWLANGDLARAQGLLDRLIAATEAGHRWGRVIEALVVQARLFQKQGRRAEAQAALERALQLAEPGGYVRTFVDGGPVVRDLLASVGILPEYVRRIRSAFRDGTAGDSPSGGPSLVRVPHAHAPAAHPSGADTLAEPLTDREIDVLALMAEGLTNQAIADRLVVSINTVKTHAKHIYEKLGVRSRAQAVLRAADLGLL